MIRQSPRSVWVGVATVFAVTFLVAGVAIDRRIARAQIRDASAELLLLMTLRRGALESYFDTVRAELTFWSMSYELRSDLSNLRRAWDQMSEDQEVRLKADYVHNNPHAADQRRELDVVNDGSLYAEAHLGIHHLAKAFVSERGYYDLFLLDPSGNVIYSVEKESDFADNLIRGPLRDSGLAHVHARALEFTDSPRVVFSDVERYAPSQDAPALFGGIAVLAPEDHRVLGVLALQIPTERIQDIMQFTAGMGRSGETYLVGSDYRMRSDSRFSDASTTLEMRVESTTVERALAHESGVEFTDDYRGIPVLSAYGSFSLDGIDWAVMAEIDRDEVFESIAEVRLSIPLLGIALYVLAMISLWMLGPGGFSLGDIEGLDIGEPPPS